MKRRERPVRMPKSVTAERRASTRFALNLEVTFSATSRHADVKSGSGRTVNLSSSGLSFTTDQPLLPGQKIDVSIDWPVLLDGSIRLQLVMSGVVVRADASFIALQIRRHEFKTRRVGVQVGTPATAS